MVVGVVHINRSSQTKPVKFPYVYRGGSLTQLPPKTLITVSPIHIGVVRTDADRQTMSSCSLHE
jgi:hypothetical protein